LLSGAHKTHQPATQQQTPAAAAHSALFVGCQHPAAACLGWQQHLLLLSQLLLLLLLLDLATPLSVLL
jgi:hypothetical protein